MSRGAENRNTNGVLIVTGDRPEDPLRVLGEYLLQRSKELEGT